MSKDEALRTALKQAYNLGQIYWQQADSEYMSQHRKADLTEAKFKELVEDTMASLEAKDEPIQAVPNFDQLQQIVNNLERCLTRDSKHEFLRVWIRDWTEHKLSKHTPPQRKPLTDEEMQRIIHEHTKLNPNQRDDKQLIGYIINATRAIEAAHGIKGEA